MPTYDYLKEHYRAYTVKLERDKDADVIAMLEAWPHGVTDWIRKSSRVFFTIIKEGNDADLYAERHQGDE